MARKPRKRVRVQPRRILRFILDDGTYTDLEVTRMTVLNKPLKEVAFHVDRLKDGSHRIIVSREVLPEGKRIDRVIMLRSEE